MSPSNFYLDVGLEYRLGVASGGGNEYVVVAAVAETLDKVAELKRRIAPDKARILALREKLEKVNFPEIFDCEHNKTLSTLAV